MSDDDESSWVVDPNLNTNLCFAPWTHTFVSPQSERRLCCASREQSQFVQQYIDQPGTPSKDYNPKTLEEHWNGDFLKSVRLKMLRGETVDACTVCQNRTLHLDTYRDYFTKHLFKHVQSEILAATQADGSTTMKPRSFDYRITNVCDFKCRMCGDQLSSAWEVEKRREGDWSPATEPWMAPDNKKKIEAFQAEVIVKELEAAIEEGRLEEIYWVGGEPLIWEDHWRLMKRLVELGHGRKVFCRYNTNLSRISWKGVHLFDDILSQVGGYSICASIDGAGRIGEWIRTGLVWEKWVENFKEGVRYKNKRGYDSIVMDVTITLPGLFSLKELFDLALELDVKMYVKLVFAFDPEKVLSPFVLPSHILHPIVDDLLAYIKPRATPRQAALVQTLEEIKRRPSFDKIYPDDWQQGVLKGKQWMETIAKRRGDGQNGKITLEEILRNKPEALDWWESIK